MGFGRISYAINQDFGARFKLPELVFQYIETDLQVFGVHDVEERHARSGGAVQRCLDPAHGPRERRRNGAEGQLAFQLPERRLGRIVAAVHTGLVAELLGRLFQILALVTLPHQDGLILIIGLFQFGFVAVDLVLQDIRVQSGHHLSFPHPLADYQVEADDLLGYPAVHGNLHDGLDGALAGEAFRLDGPLQVVHRDGWRAGRVRGRDGRRYGLGKISRCRGRRTGLAGGKGGCKGYEKKRPIHTA